MSDSIKVAIKVRPLIKREKDDNSLLQWTVQGNSIFAADPELRKRGDGGFYFDHIFDKDVDNSLVFDTIVKPIVDAAVSGFNGTVFAYGQTSSGKTYTMMGTPEELGVIPLAVEHIFDAISSTVGREFLLRVSYLEIYNEKVNDLLNKAGGDIKIHEDGSGQVIVKCKEELTNCPENVLAIMKKGNKNRRIGETNMNERSSRSHTIFRITIESREAGTDSDGAIQVSQLNLVDLAGSERARQTGATGERFKEGRHINLSLSTLGLVIMQLSDSQDGQKHVNFRDSKLTRLLQASLGGNAMTAIICAVTPAALDETQCTLSFASRAKSVKNKPQVNEVMTDTALLKRYARQIAMLNAEMEKVKNEKEKISDGYNQLLEERLELLQNKIVAGDTANHEESFKCKANRRRTWGGPSTFKSSHFPVFQPSTGLPTIKEMSPEKSHRMSVIQSLNIMNQTFQTAFADFEIELLESERDRETTNDGSDSEDEPFITKRDSGHRVQFEDDALSPLACYIDVTPEKQSKEIQTVIKSPSTPKHVLRGIVSDLTEKYDSLREYATLEKQLICEEKQCCQHAENLKKFTKLKDEMQDQGVNRTDENVSLPHRQLKEIIDLTEQYEDLGIKEGDAVEDVITILCQKLKAVESESRLEKGLTEQLQSRTKALEDQIEILVSERTNLCTELCAKTSELESMNYKSLDEQLTKQMELVEVMEMKNQDLEAQCAEHQATIEKIQHENKSLKEQIIHQDDFLSDIQNKNKGLRKQIMEQEEAIRNLQDNNTILEKRFVDQEQDLENIKVKNNMLEEQLETQAKAVNNLVHNNETDNEKHNEVVPHHEESIQAEDNETIHLDVHLDNSELNESELDASKIIVDLEHEKDRLKTDLEMKNQELEEIKNDVQSLKLDMVKLDQTIQMLTNENMELHTILSEEKKRSEEAELNSQKTMNDLYSNVSTLTDEKINLETELQITKEQLQVLNSKTAKISEQGELLSIYTEQIDKLKSENIELIALIEEKNKELEKIKESKSLLFEHDCIYKDKITDLAERNTYLISENDELSTDLMDKIEEIETLKTECETLKGKIKLSLENIETSGDDDVEHLRAENNVLRAEVMELKMKVATLADENTTFSNNLLESMEDLSNSRNESIYNNTLHLSTVFSKSVQLNETATDIIEDGNREVLVNEILKLRSEAAHLNRLNQKLSDLKLKTCSQCAHLQSLKENHRTLKVETKHIAHRFKDLQKKFDRKCEEVEALKIKANQDINLTHLEISLNGSFQDPLSVSFVEEKIEHLGNELRALQDANDQLSVAYKEKCEEFEHVQEEAKLAGVSGELKAKNTGKNEGRYDEIQKSIHRVALDIDDMKKDYNNWNTVLHRYKEERASLVEEIDMLKSMNEQLSQKASENEVAAATFAEKAQMLEKEISTMTKEIEQYVLKEKESESEKLTMEVVLEELKSDKENRDAVIEKLHKTIDELNETLLSVKSDLDLMNNQKCEILSSKEAIEQKYDNELQQLKKLCEELENEKKNRINSQEDLLLREKELELNLKRLTSELQEQKDACSGHHEKISELGDLVKLANEMKEALQEKLNSAETMYKNELDLVSQKLTDTTKKSEDEVKAVKEALNKYVQENNSLTQELVRMRDIEDEYKRNKNEAINRSSQEQELINDNKKLKDEINSARECIMKELKSLKHNENTMELLSKSINEIFIIFLQTLVSKEEEVIKTMREQFEKGKHKLDDERRQCQDAEKRALTWVKELEAEIEKLQADLSKHEHENSKYQENMSELDRLLRECNHERDMLREKFETLETDYSNLQVEFEKQRQADAHQEETILIAQKQEKEMLETFKNKETELQTKLNAEKIMYESRIQDLTSTLEIYKTENVELKNNVENLESNEKQLKNIINANSAEISKNNLQIERLNDQIDELSKAYKEVNRIVEEKRLKIDEISGLLKSKCDTVFEYKTQLDTITPEYELLQEQVKSRKVSIERYQEEIEALRIEKERQLKMIQGKLNLEEEKNVDLQKQSIDMNNRNMALVGELDELKEKYELLQQENIKLERKMRKSTSKVKAEAEMDDLRDKNKRLQNNLDGASNCITELQENKNLLMKKLESLKGEYSLLQQENADLKRTVSSYKSKAHISPAKDDEKYDTILYEKNRIALELEGLKLILSQKDKQVEKCKDEIDQLMQKNKDLDKELDEYAVVIQDLTDEKAILDVKLHSYLNDNNIVRNLEEKVKNLQEENDRLQKEWEAAKIQTEKLCNDAKMVYSLKKDNMELLEKINELESKFDVKSNSSGSRCSSPAFENTRRRHSRNEIFNQRRLLENAPADVVVSEAEERCQILRKKIRELELELVAKNGKIAALEVQIQSENFPYQRKCTELQEKLLAYTKTNAELKAQITKLQRVKDEINSWDCETCRRWRVNRRDMDCQTMPDNMVFANNTIRFSSIKSGIVPEHFNMAKLEKQNKLAREICRSRSRRIKELEDRVKELEDASNSPVLRPLDVDNVTSNHQHGSVFPDRRQDYEKNLKPVMKENIPVNIMGSRQYRLLEDSVAPKIDRSAGSSFFNKM